jgi:hypothetical protein
VTAEASDVGKMMGQHEGQRELFSYGVEVDRRVPADHPLRRLQALVDFTFARAAFAHASGDNGNVSGDPVVRWKSVFLLFPENVRRERERVRRLPRAAGLAVVAGRQPG